VLRDARAALDALKTEGLALQVDNTEFDGEADIKMRRADPSPPPIRRWVRASQSTKFWMANFAWSAGQ
jgi:hypothetical protein